MAARRAFTEVRASHRLHGNTAVRWRMDPLFRPQGSVEFALEWARTPTGEWMKADEALVFDAGVALDPEQRLFGSTLELFYRVSATAPEGVYYSHAAQVGAYLDGRGWLQAQELVRLAALNYDNNTDASPGCLFKRRVWGKPCSRCRDKGTGQVVNEDCLVCFGTGIEGGYYSPVPCTVVLQPRKRAYRWADSASGPVFSHGRQANCMAYPVPVDERDLWYNNRTGEFYTIAAAGDEVEDSLKLGDFVIEQRFPVAVVPAGSVVYRLPLEGCGVDDGAADSGECQPWREEEPGCLVPVPDEQAGSASNAAPDRLPRPEIPVETPTPPENERLQWL